MIVEGVRIHLVPQFGYRLADRGLEHIFGGSADPGLTKADENGEFYIQAEGGHLIIDDLLCAIVLQRRHELQDVGVLQVACSAPGVARDEGGELAYSLVGRVSGTVEAENEGASPSRRDLRVGNPFGIVLGGRCASEAATVVEARRGGGHLGG
jgi:hypothetical protein